MPQESPAGRRNLPPVASATLLVLWLLAGCGSTTATPGTGPITFSDNPCSVTGTLTLAVAQTARVDCSNGGTTLTLAGGGANYLVVAQFAGDQGNNAPALYHIASGSLASAAVSAQRAAGSVLLERQLLSGEAGGVVPPHRPSGRQTAFDGRMRARGVRLALEGNVRHPTVSAGVSNLVSPPPDVGSTRSFHVIATFDQANPVWQTITAQLVYAGSNLLLYIDQAAPTNGFTADQLQAFGKLFDETLYPLVTQDFGPPSDVDQNGRFIMLMSPVVNADSPAAQCTTQGYVAGFFDPDDFDGPSNVNSNQGEIFYSVVPDPTGSVSCVHSVAELGDVIPSTFVHELQHLVNYSRHVVINQGQPQSSWLDEGLSIIAEEMGSLYYEQRCPPPSCRTDPSQVFPDSSQGFVSNFLYDSYQYALLPDTASLTMHVDSDNGFGWRGGEWAMLRWIGDHFGVAAFKQLAEGPADGASAISQVTGESFPEVMADFGLSLYVDSLPNLPRTTVLPANRFVTRNMSQMWARLYLTSGPSTDIPYSFPVLLYPITTDTSSALLTQGSMTYFRLDTPVASPTVTIRFAGPGGVPLNAALHPQLAVLRLPQGY